MAHTEAGEATPAAARIRVYDAVRTAHLERFRTMTPAVVAYAGTRYDFDRSLAGADLDLRPLGRWSTVWHLWRTPYDAVELNEPLMTYRWIDLALQLAAVRIGARARRRRVQVGAYCISLTDPAAKLHARRRVPVRIATAWSRLMLTCLVRQYDRLAFGTQASRDLVRSYTGETLLAPRARLFPAVSAACGCLGADGTEEERDSTTVLFVGAFDERKGIRQLMQAWDRVAERDIGLRLTLIGQGDLVDAVHAWSERRPEVTVLVDPPRADVHLAYRRAHVLVLLSQRVRYWREQVGLPIVEGLAHGCEVVCTDETGLAEWLRDHGHRVIAAPGAVSEVAATLEAAAASSRTAQEVLSVLPQVDSRWAADRWLLAVDG